MFRELTFFGCLIVLTVLAGSSVADVLWDDSSGDHRWTTAVNWDTNVVPTSTDAVRITGLASDITIDIVTGETAECDKFKLRDGTMNMSGTASLQVSSWGGVGSWGGVDARLNMSGTASLTVATNLDIGYEQVGYLHVTDNATVRTSGRLMIGRSGANIVSPGIGHLQLDGGIIEIPNLIMNNDGGKTTKGTMDIAGGTLIIDGDQSTTIQRYIDNGWITAYGGNSEVLYDYDITTAGKTTVTTKLFTMGQALFPNPENEAKDVSRDVVLRWTPGEFAAPTNGHKVYFGESFEDVDAGIGGITQSANSYIPERLDFDKVYYWRVDEFNNLHPDSPWIGSVWSFTTEPFAYPISGETITAIASSTNRTDEGPENTINGAGLDEGGVLHNNISIGNMWLSNITDPNVSWIQYEFDSIYKLYQMLVWNYNSSVEPIVGFGIREATIEYSIDGTNWVALGGPHEFARGTGSEGYAHNTVVDFSGVTAQYVRITANSNWGAMVNQYGLSEVRFLYIPVWATEPIPASGATDVSVDTTLSFRAGREAAKHDIYLGTDEQAVINGTATVTTVTEPSYAASLDLASTYYWRVDEVNDAETPTTWQGDVWNLSTQEYLVVEDFESYNDVPAGEEGSNLIYDTWSDGYDNPANGSTIGYNEPFQPTIETSLVYDGMQSVPLLYDNTAATYSEVTAKMTDLGVGGDWSKHGIKALTIRFFGDPNNVTQQMYVKINGSKVSYDGDAENLKRVGWQMWYIDLASTGMSLSNVTELSIGLDRIGTINGHGMILLDGVRLYSYDRQLITPVEPDATGLQAHYEFEGNTNDSSGNARHGSTMGNPTFVAGRLGQAISFDGLSDYVNIDGYKGILADADEVQHPFTITCWFQTIGNGEMVTWGSSPARQRLSFRINEGRLRTEHGSGNLQGDTTCNDGQWHHAALTVTGGAGCQHPETILWLDGVDDVRLTTGTSNTYNLTSGADVSIGRRADDDTRYFTGIIDNVRIYDRVLSPEEIAWLSGRIAPFDEPF